MVRYRFQLMGVPLAQKTKFIECDPNQNSTDLKQIVQRESIKFLAKFEELGQDFLY